MKKIKLNFNILILYNQFSKIESEIRYNIKEYVDSNLNLKEAIDYVYKLYDIKINKDKKRYEYIDLINYLFNDFNFDWVEFDYDDVLKVKINTLEKLFEISKKELSITYMEGIGATVGEENGIKFIFHSKEKDIHHEPHIHCKYSGEEFRIDLISLKILKNDKQFKSKTKTKEAINYVKRNQKRLLKFWNTFVIYGLPFDFEGDL